MGLPPTRTKGSADSTPVVTFEIDAPNIPITHNGVIATIGTIPIAGGGTGQVTQTAAFDALQPMTTGGDIIYGGASGTGTRLANGSAGQVLTSGGTTVAPSWTTISAGGALSVVSKTTTYTATTSDNIILCSGSAFTVTLYTAVGNSGRTLTFKKTDSSLTNIITIDGAGTETIDTNLTATLNVQFESIVIISDGTNWQILDRQDPQGWFQFTPTFTNNVWTSGGQPGSVAVYGRKCGANLIIRGTFNSPSAQTNLADMILPSPWVADSTLRTLSVVGSVHSTGASSNQGYTLLATPSSATLNMGTKATASTDLSTTQANNLGSNVNIYFLGTIPINGWKF